MKNGISGRVLLLTALVCITVSFGCAASGKNSANQPTPVTGVSKKMNLDANGIATSTKKNRPTQSKANKDSTTEGNVAHVSGDKADSKKPGISKTKTVRFQWCPRTTAQASYDLPEAADQHRVVFPKGLVKGKSYPIVIAFHGQPKRGKDPRAYSFMAPVEKKVLDMVAANEIEPVILVMPVFRFLGSNWPWFHPKRFQQKVEEILQEEGFGATDWYAFGHSGAAGCGGQGLNQVHLINPKGVGFFDTCLGDGWQDEIGALQKAKVPTFNIHSVETAGFKPKQRPEYQADFNFGRAYSPLGIEPVTCPAVHPGQNLRTLKHRCSATKDGVIKSFVIDTGEGQEAHKNILEPAIDFFLKNFFGK